MTDVHSVRDEASLITFCNEHGLALHSLGTTLYDRALHVINIEGRSDQPPIVITAGSHATEPAGVLAALELARTLRTPQRIVIVPIRDPLGWEGYERCLSLASGGVPVQLTDHEALKSLLVRLGDVLWEDEQVTIAQVGEIAFLSMAVSSSGRGPMDMWKHLHGLLDGNDGLLARLQGQRLVLPENLPDVEGCGLYTHAFSAWVTPEGGVANYNRLFSMDNPPPEVAVVARLIRDLRPELVIDLHESQGSRFMIFAHPEPALGAREIYYGATGAVFAAGYEIERLNELEHIIGSDHAAKFTDHGGGVISGLNEFPGQGWQFTHLCSELGAVTVTTEPGRWQPLRDRVDQQTLAARGAIFAYMNAEDRGHGPG